MMDRLLCRLDDFCRAHSSPPDALLQELERETHLKTLSPQMLTEPHQGRFLQWLCEWVAPRRVLEIGTFTGYATICLARGAGPAAEVHTIEGNDEVLPIARRYFRRAGLEPRIHIHQGDAFEILPALEGSFQLIFLDAAKRDYPAFFPLLLEKLEPGGLLLADNVLWHGNTLQPQPDPDTRALLRFLELAENHPLTEQVLLPLHDGLLLIRKKKER
ncbi:MAG: O-methyltransferase [Bacteroidetes bacterium]|nr:MAG: O-methyltransferase [Bacteroidota bacterium]